MSAQITQPLWRFATGYDDSPTVDALSEGLSSYPLVSLWNPVTGRFVGPRLAGEGESISFDAGMMGIDDFARYACEEESYGSAFADALEALAAREGLMRFTLIDEAESHALHDALAAAMLAEPGGWINIDISEDPIGPIEVLYDFLCEIDPEAASSLQLRFGAGVEALRDERMLLWPSHLEPELLLKKCDGRAMWSPIEARVFYVTGDDVRAVDGISPNDALRDLGMLASQPGRALPPYQTTRCQIEDLASSPLLLWLNESASAYPMRDQVFDIGEMMRGQHSVAAAMMDAALTAMEPAPSLGSLERSLHEVAGAHGHPGAIEAPPVR